MDDREEFLEIVWTSFSENEVEQLTDFARYMFGLVDRGVTVTLRSALILEILDGLRKGGESD